MKCTFGAVEIVEQTYWDGRNGGEIRPLSEDCGLHNRGYSRRLQRAITDFAADTSFGGAVEKIEEHYGFTVPESSCRVIALGHAEDMAERYLPDPPAAFADILIAEADGSMVPIVEIDGSAEGDHRKHRTLLWKEIKLSQVRQHGKLDALVAATFGGPEACGKQWYDTAIAAGLGKATHVHALGDGAVWINNQVDEQFGKQASYLVDMYHVCEYLAPVARLTGKGSATWLETQKNRLLNNELPKVLADIKPWFEPEKESDAPDLPDAPVVSGVPDVPDTPDVSDKSKPPTPARDCHRYLSNRSDQLDYKSAIEQKLPIGSGEVESANRSVIQQRLKRPGAWWKINNAQSMANLQALRQNGQWDNYWDSIRKAA